MRLAKKMLIKAEIAKTTCPRRLARLLDENNIAKLGVHVFYPDNCTKRGHIILQVSWNGVKALA